MVKPNFHFEAMLAYEKSSLTEKEMSILLEFIKNYTVEINEVDLSRLEYGGTILN